MFPQNMDLSILQDFNYRSKRIIREIEIDNPSIITFNEVDFYHKFYKSKLAKLGYDCRVVWRRGIDAVLIGWKRYQFEYISSQKVDYEDLV